MNKTSFLKFFLPARCILFLLIFAVGALITGKEFSGISCWWSIVASAVNILTILFLVISAKKGGSSYRGLIAYEKGKTPLKKTILLIIGFIFIGMAGLYGAGYICYGVLPYSPPMILEPIPLILAILNIAVLPVTTALAEDGLYLGGGVNQIKNKFTPQITAHKKTKTPKNIFTLRFILKKIVLKSFFFCKTARTAKKTAHKSQTTEKLKKVPKKVPGDEICIATK